MERLTKFANNKTCCVDFMKAECFLLDGHCYSCSTNDKAWDKLRYYEELEEQGLLNIKTDKGGYN